MALANTKDYCLCIERSCSCSSELVDNCTCSSPRCAICSGLFGPRAEVANISSTSNIYETIPRTVSRVLSNNAIWGTATTQLRSSQTEGPYASHHFGGGKIAPKKKSKGRGKNSPWENENLMVEDTSFLYDQNHRKKIRALLEHPATRSIAAENSLHGLPVKNAQRAVETFQSDGMCRYNDPEFVAEAIGASERRANREFEEYEDSRFNDTWRDSDSSSEYDDDIEMASSEPVTHGIDNTSHERETPRQTHVPVVQTRRSVGGLDGVDDRGYHEEELDESEDEEVLIPTHDNRAQHYFRPRRDDEDDDTNRGGLRGFSNANTFSNQSLVHQPQQRQTNNDNQKNEQSDLYGQQSRQVLLGNPIYSNNLSSPSPPSSMGLLSGHYISPHSSSMVAGSPSISSNDLKNAQSSNVPKNVAKSADLDHELLGDSHAYAYPADAPHDSSFGQNIASATAEGADSDFVASTGPYLSSLESTSAYAFYQDPAPSTMRLSSVKTWEMEPAYFPDVSEFVGQSAESSAPPEPLMQESHPFAPPSGIDPRYMPEIPRHFGQAHKVVFPYEFEGYEKHLARAPVPSDESAPIQLGHSSTAIYSSHTTHQDDPILFTAHPPRQKYPSPPPGGLNGNFFPEHEQHCALPPPQGLSQAQKLRNFYKAALRGTGINLDRIFDRENADLVVSDLVVGQIAPKRSSLPRGKTGSHGKRLSSADNGDTELELSAPPAKRGRGRARKRQQR